MKSQERNTRMNKFQHFVAKHKFLSFFILIMLACGIYSFLLMMLNVPLVGIIIVNLLLVFVIYAYVEYSPEPIMRKALKELNDNCDPYPLLKETEKLLTYKNSEVLEQIILINHAVGHRSVGEYQKNLDILKTLNIDKTVGIQPMQKVVYYNNLMDACGMLEKYDEAEVWYSKMMLILADIKNEKQLEALESAMQSATAFHHFCQKEYDKALQIMREKKDINRNNAVDNAMLYAKIATAMGDIDTAKNKLQFVIENGNRLYAVQEAKERLAELNV